VLVHLACSFDPRGGEQVSSATVAVELARVDREPDPAPLAWSMEPRCLPQVTELSRTQKLDASLKVVGFSVGTEHRSTRTACVVQAFNELQPNPRWEFRKARGVTIQGTQRLVMVVQSGAPALALISLSANVRRGGLLRMRRSYSLEEKGRIDLFATSASTSGCSKCGHENRVEDDFCARCGTYLRWEDTD
jgi:hypothetical protein